MTDKPDEIDVARAFIPTDIRDMSTEELTEALLKLRELRAERTARTRRRQAAAQVAVAANVVLDDMVPEEMRPLIAKLTPEQRKELLARLVQQRQTKKTVVVKEAERLLK